MNITALGHAAIRVRDLASSERFYSGVLGMPVVMRFPEEQELGFGIGKSSVFMVHAVGKDAPAPDARTLGIHHMAFIVGNTPDTLSAAANRLNEHGVAALRDQLDTFWRRALDGFQQQMNENSDESMDQHHDQEEDQ